MFRTRLAFTAMAVGFGFVLLAQSCGGTSETADDADAGPTTTAEATVDATNTTTAAPVQGDGHDDGHDYDADRIVEVMMDDFTFEPADFKITAGETVTFIIINGGVVEHEFRLSNEHRIEERLASGDDDYDEVGGYDDVAGHHEDADMFLLLEAGESGEITVTFPMDMTIFTEVACLIPGHYEAGMAATLGYDA